MRRYPALVACFVLCSFSSLFGQGSTILTVPGGIGREQLGAAVDIDGDTLVAGAPGDDQNGFDAGAVYVFVRSGTDWVVQAQLVGSDTIDEDAFGFAVQVDGDRLVVGAPHAGAAAMGSGAAYVFERVGPVWTQTAKLVSSDAAQADRFGVSVALDGGRIVIGAPRADGFQTDIGAAYVFGLNGTVWTENAKLRAGDPGLRHQLGTSVAIEGNRIVSGAPRAVGAVDNTGAAYVFEFGSSGWAQVAKAFSPNGTTGDYLGRSLALAGNRLIVGAPGEDRAIDGSGKIFEFAHSGGTWNEVGMMTEDVPSSNARLGLSVALEGDLIFSGAPHPSRRGRALAFGENAGNWAEQRRYRAGPGTTNRHRFGSSVAVDGSTLVVGMPGDDGSGTDSGAVHLFDVVGIDPKHAFLEDTVSAPGAPGISFGRHVALSGDTAAMITTVGMDGFYIAERAGSVWSAPTLLFDGSNGLRDVAIDGDTAVVTTTSQAHVFVRSGTGWTQQASFPGHSDVAIAGDLIFVRPGSVWLRVGSNWSLDHTLPGSITALDTDGVHLVIVNNANTQVYRFVPGGSTLVATLNFGGQSVALDGDRLAVGRINTASNGVRIFDGLLAGTPQAVQTLLLPGFPDFGASLSLSGDTLVVGTSTAPNQAGRAVVFYEAARTWHRAQEPRPAELQVGDMFGFSVAVDAGTALVSAPGLAIGTQNWSGAVSVYRVSRPPTNYCAGKPNSLGCVPFLTSGGGSPSPTETLPFNVSANQVLFGELGILTYGFGGLDLDFHGGKLCVKAPTTLAPIAAAAVGPPPCTGVLTGNFNAVIQSGADPLLSVGQTVYLQWQQNDPADPAGFGDSFSDGLSLAICP